MSLQRKLVPVLLVFLLTPLTSLRAAANETADTPKKVTYARDVAPVLNTKCVRCHRPGEIAPMALRTYDEVRPWAKTIRRVVSEGEMPPWDADPAHGRFKNDRSLDEQEIALVERWVRQGAKLGDPADLPEPPSFSEGWRLGEPDLIVTFDEVTVGAGGPDLFHDLTAAVDLPGDRWLRAVEVLPGDRRVVHHVIIYAVREGGGPPASGWIGAWAAGMEPMIFPDGTAKEIKAGATLVADMHYHPTGEEATDQTRIGLYFYDGEPQKELINLWVQNATFKIPAGADNHEVRSSYTFPQDSTVYGLLPHMHYRGKDFTYTATYPDGRREVLLQVNDYDFNWQTLYELAEPLKMPKGSRIDCVAHFDNSTNNPDNPDPSVDVTFGNESYDEMMIGFVDYVVDDGVRPTSPEEQVARILEQLSGEHPGEVYAVRVTEGSNGIDTALYFPASGDGKWFIPINGQVHEGRLHEIERSGTSFEAKLSAAFGQLAVSGQSVEDGRGLEGEVRMGDVTLSYVGGRVD